MYWLFAGGGVWYKHGMKPLCKQTKWMGALLVALVTLAVFFPVLQGEFLSWDDDGLFVQNPYFRGLSPAHWQWMCTTFMFGHWQPLSWLSYALDYTLWGMNPHGWHFTNLMIHTLNALLVYRLCLDFSGLGRKNSLNAVPALAALFWAAHPLRVEAVAWLSTRGYLLCTTFCLLTVLFYLRPGRKPYLAALLCFALATATKGIGMMLPPVLVLADWQRAKGMAHGEGKPPNNRQRITDNWKRLAGTLPFFALSLVTGVTAFLAKKADGGMVPLERYGLVERLGQAIYGIWFYLLKTVSPQNLSPLYDKRPEPWQILITLTLTALATVTFFLFRQKLRPAIVATGAFLLLTFPVLGITQSGSQMYADRFTYLATVPFFLLLAAGLGKVTMMRRTVHGVSVVLLLVFSIQALGYSFVWNDSLSLWHYAVSIDRNSASAHNSLGQVLMGLEEHTKAVECFNRAILLKPDYPIAQYNRALTRAAMGEHKKALTDAGEAIAKGNLDRNDRAKMLIGRGLIAEQIGHFDLSSADFSAVIADPDVGLRWKLTALQARARLHFTEGKEAEGKADLEAILRGPDLSGEYWQRARFVLDNIKSLRRVTSETFSEPSR